MPLGLVCASCLSGIQPLTHTRELLHEPTYLVDGKFPGGSK